MLVLNTACLGAIACRLKAPAKHLRFLFGNHRHQGSLGSEMSLKQTRLANKVCTRLRGKRTKHAGTAARACLRWSQISCIAEVCATQAFCYKRDSIPFLVYSPGGVWFHLQDGHVQWFGEFSQMARTWRLIFHFYLQLCQIRMIPQGSVSF